MTAGHDASRSVWSMVEAALIDGVPRRRIGPAGADPGRPAHPLRLLGASVQPTWAAPVIGTAEQRRRAALVRQVRQRFPHDAPQHHRHLWAIQDARVRGEITVDVLVAAAQDLVEPWAYAADDRPRPNLVRPHAPAQRRRTLRAQQPALPSVNEPWLAWTRRSRPGPPAQPAGRWGGMGRRAIPARQRHPGIRQRRRAGVLGDGRRAGIALPVRGSEPSRRRSSPSRWD